MCAENRTPSIETTAFEIYRIAFFSYLSPRQIYVMTLMLGSRPIIPCCLSGIDSSVELIKQHHAGIMRHEITLKTISNVAGEKSTCGNIKCNDVRIPFMFFLSLSHFNNVNSKCLL